MEKKWLWLPMVMILMLGAECFSKSIEITKSNYSIAEIQKLLIAPNNKRKSDVNYQKFLSLHHKKEGNGFEVGEKFNGDHEFSFSYNKEGGVSGLKLFRDKDHIIKITCLYYHSTTPVFSDPNWLDGIFAGSQPLVFLIDTLNEKGGYLVVDNSTYGQPPKDTCVQLHSYDTQQYLLISAKGKDYFIAHISKSIIKNDQRHYLDNLAKKARDNARLKNLAAIKKNRIEVPQ